MATQRTFSIIKPDATKRNLTGKVNSIIEAAGLRIVAQRRVCGSDAVHVPPVKGHFRHHIAPRLYHFPEGVGAVNPTREAAAHANDSDVSGSS